MTKKIISLIIPVFNNLDFTKKCLKNLSGQLSRFSQNAESVKIIIVDDGSTDGTSSWVLNNYPNVEVLSGDGNLWWSGGINKGMRFAIDALKTDYILWWNNDILSDAAYFENLFQLIKSHPENVIFGSKIFFLGKELIWGMGGRFEPKKGVKYMYGQGKRDGLEFGKPLDVDWFPGMGTCFHSSIINKIGFLDEKNFPQYHGDSDYTFRAKKAGFQLIAFPQLIIYNDKSSSGIVHEGSIKKLFSSVTSIRSNFNINKNILFLKKHATSPVAYLPLLKKYIKYFGGFIKWKLLGLIGKKKS